MFGNNYWAGTAGDLMTTILQTILDLLLTPLNALTSSLYAFLNGIMQP